MISRKSRGLRMGKVLGFFILFLFLGFSGYAFAQTADDYFQQGKDNLEHQYLYNAQNNFQTALSLDPNHQGANLFYAITRLLMISQSSDFNLLLDRAGVSSSGRNIFNWTADFTRDPNGKVLLPSDTPTGLELQTFLKNKVLPEVVGAIGNLSQMSNGYNINYKWIYITGSGSVSGLNTFTDTTKNWYPNDLAGSKVMVSGVEYTITANTATTLTVTPNWTIPSGNYNYEIYDLVEIDYGDVLVFKGGLYTAKGLITILSAYDINVDIDTIVSLFSAGTLSIQQHIINTYQQFLTLLPGQQLSQAKADLQDAFNIFTDAINFIVARTDPQNNHLIVIDDPAEETRFRNLLQDLGNSLNGTTYIREIEEYVNLSQFLDSPKVLRNYFPTTFRGLYIVRDTYPDPTFGGIFPYMTSSKLNQYFEVAGLLVGPFPTPVVYDDFSGTYIDKAKWVSGEMVREIDTVNQKLVMKQGSPLPPPGTTYPYVEFNTLNFTDPDSVTSIQADVAIIDSSVSANAYASAQLSGSWYNDGSGTPGSNKTGDIGANVALIRGPTGLYAKWFVWRYTNASGAYTYLGNGVFTTKTITSGTTYTLYVAYDQGANKFTFRVTDGVGTEEKTFVPGSGYAWVRSANLPTKNVGTRVEIDTSSDSAYISSTFDNVYKSDSLPLYDDFSSSKIDSTKWITYEIVREISGGKLRSKTRSSGTSTSNIFNELPIVNPNSINFISAKFTPIIYQNLQGANINTSIAGNYYNDGTPGGGNIGEIAASVYIGGSGVDPVGGWNVFTFTDTAGNNGIILASGTFSKPISLNSTYTLFLGWDGRTFTFKIDDEVAYYNTSGGIPPHYPNRKVRTRIMGLGPNGKEATIEALIDDVMVGGPWTPALKEPHGTINTAIPTYRWEAVSGATSYQLYVSDSAANPKINQSYTPSNANCPSNFGDCWVIPSTNIAQGNATWWVLASNSIGNSPWSIGMDFYVCPAPPVIQNIVFKGCISELCKSPIQVVASDPCGGTLTYTYEPLDGGTIIGSGSSVVFGPPAISSGYPCPHRVKVTVTSSNTGLSTSQTIGIYVKIAGDINGDGNVNATDKLLLTKKLGWEGQPGAISEDINCDGKVNATDKLILSKKLGLGWGCGCK